MICTQTLLIWENWGWICQVSRRRAAEHAPVKNNMTRNYNLISTVYLQFQSVVLRRQWPSSSYGTARRFSTEATKSLRQIQSGLQEMTRDWNTVCELRAEETEITARSSLSLSLSLSEGSDLVGWWMACVDWGGGVGWGACLKKKDLVLNCQAYGDGPISVLPRAKPFVAELW